MALEISSALTVAASWLWDQFGATAVKQSSDQITKSWSKQAWFDRELRYRERLINTYSTTKLLGYPKSVSVEQIYTELYVLDNITASRRFRISTDGAELKSESDSKPLQARVSLMSQLKKHHRLYILGKPGAGKTTFLRIACMACCRGAIPKTPIFISLKEWYHPDPDKRGIVDYIVEQFDIHDFPDAENFVTSILNSGAALVLMDGLDEIPGDAGERHVVANEIVRFSKKYPKIQIALTCRIAATDHSLDEFQYLEVADFTSSQQQSFMARWYEDQPELFVRLQAAWNDSSQFGIRDLAKTPLLLALMCLVFDETHAFPKRRVDLYQEAVNAMLRKWDSSRGIIRNDAYKALPHVRREQLLEHLAGATFPKGAIYFRSEIARRCIDQFLSRLPKADLGQAFDSEDVLLAIEAQHGLVVQQAHGVYSFSHLTIHEYFTAKYFLASMSSSQLTVFVSNHLESSRWREVILMLASLMYDATSFFMGILSVFNRRCFSDESIIRLCRRISEYEGGFSGVETSVNSHELKAIIESCKELRKSLTSNSDEGRIIWRLNKAIYYLGNLTEDDISPYSRAPLALNVLLSYVNSLPLVIECLQISNLEDRKGIVDALIFPVLSGGQ